MFLPPNQQGESVEKQWMNDHSEFRVENEDNPEFLVIYVDSSLTKKNSRCHTGFRAVGYYLGSVAFTTKGALGEQAKVFDTKMAGLSAAAEIAKQFILNSPWTQQPTHIVFYADNSAAISHIHNGTLGKAQEHSLAFREHITEILNSVKEALIAISWVPGHSNIPGNEEADQLAKEGAKQCPTQCNFKTQAFMASLHRREMLEAWTHKWNNHQTHPSSGFLPANTLPPMLSPTNQFKDLDHKTFSRLIQFCTGHAHIGEYYKQFIRTEDLACP